MTEGNAGKAKAELQAKGGRCSERGEGEIERATTRSCKGRVGGMREGVRREGECKGKWGETRQDVLLELFALKFLELPLQYLRGHTLGGSEGASVVCLCLCEEKIEGEQCAASLFSWYPAYVMQCTLKHNGISEDVTGAG